MAPSFFTKSALRARSPPQPGTPGVPPASAPVKQGTHTQGVQFWENPGICSVSRRPNPSQPGLTLWTDKTRRARSQGSSKRRLWQGASPARSIPWKCDPIRCPLFRWSPPSVPLAIPAYEFAPNFAPSLFREYRSSRLRHCRLDAVRGAVVGEANASDRASGAGRT